MTAVHGLCPFDVLQVGLGSEVQVAQTKPSIGPDDAGEIRRAHGADYDIGRSPCSAMKHGACCRSGPSAGLGHQHGAADRPGSIPIVGAVVCERVSRSPNLLL